MPLFIYSVARFALLAVVFAALWFIGMGGWLWLATGLILSSVIAYLTMTNLRDASSAYLADRAVRRKETAKTSVHDQESALEDEHLDAN